MRIQIAIAVSLLVCFAVAGPLSAESSVLDGIAHVAFRVNDLEKSRQFYEMLGFQQSFQFDEGGKVTQAFMKISDRQFIELYPRTEDSQSLGLMHVCYEATDIESVRNAYLKNGLTPTETKKARAGNLLFVLHDPDGQLVEYTQYLPGSLHSEDRGKHLGTGRISTHLQAAATIVKDPAAEQAFYIDKLGFRSAGSNAREQIVRVPGSRSDEVNFVARDSSRSQITFEVANVKRAREALHRRGLEYRMSKEALVADDPDGNSIVFRKKH